MPAESTTGGGTIGSPGGYSGGSVPAPNPLQSPITLTTPGVTVQRVPRDVSEVVIEIWGSGGGGGGKGAGTGASGNLGGAGGGYGKASLGAPLYVPGGDILVTVGPGTAGVADGIPAKGGISKVVHESVTVIASDAADPVVGGKVTVSGAAGVEEIDIADGDPTGSPDGNTGGAGGKGGGTAGGAGGAGGANTLAGKAGTAPGGGGGGSGRNGTPGGSGAAGKVVISW